MIPVEPTPPLEPAPVEERPKPKPKRGLSAGLVALLLLVLGKLKTVFALFKLLPGAKLLLTSASMVTMIAVEAQRSGWPFAAGFVLLILLHELGHGYAMRISGVQAGWPVFIPFVGAMISMRGVPRSRNTEAVIAYGGPLAGAIASACTAGVGLLLQSPLWLALAYSGFFLNLFNLTPLSPLDGGRITQAFSKRAWILGGILIGAMLLLTGTPQLLLIALMGAAQFFSRKREEEERETLAIEVQRAWAVRYFGLCAFLALGVYLSGRVLHPG
jgi:Zn-dependent protease